MQTPGTHWFKRYKIKYSTFIKLQSQFVSQSFARENLLYITSMLTFYAGTIENYGLYLEFSPNHSATYYIEFQCRFMTKITQPIYVSFDYVIYHTHKIKLASANWTGLNPIMYI